MLIIVDIFLVVAGLMKGIIGVGMPIVALPLLSMLIDVRAAVMLLAVPLILSNVPQAIEGGRTLECFRRLVPVLLGMVPGIFPRRDHSAERRSTTTKVIAGCVIVVVAGRPGAAPKFELREKRS